MEARVDPIYDHYSGYGETFDEAIKSLNSWLIYHNGKDSIITKDEHGRYTLVIKSRLHKAKNVIAIVNKNNGYYKASLYDKDSYEKAIKMLNRERSWFDKFIDYISPHVDVIDDIIQPDEQTVLLPK